MHEERFETRALAYGVESTVLKTTCMSVGTEQRWNHESVHETAQEREQLFSPIF